MRTRPRVTLTLPEGYVTSIDKERGLIPRSKYFELIISQYLEKDISLKKVVLRPSAKPEVSRETAKMTKSRKCLK